MEGILTFIRDKVVGVPYIILVIVCVFLIFSIIGYLVSLNYRTSSKLDKIWCFGIFFLSEILKEGFISNYNNLYLAIDITINKVVGVICALDKSVNLNYDYDLLKSVNSNYKVTIDKYINPIIEEVNHLDDKSIYIMNVCVDKEMRGKKIGINLLGYYIKKMENNYFDKFYLDCLLHNLPAKNLYHSLGFREMKLIN